MNRKNSCSNDILVERVRKYLANHNKPYVGLCELTRVLQRTHNEYERQKFISFRKLVKTAYEIVVQSFGVNADNLSVSDSNSEDSDCALMPEANPLSNMISNLYTKPRGAAPLQAAEPAPDTTLEIAIDISSEGSNSDCEQELQSNTHATNGKINQKRKEKRKVDETANNVEISMIAENSSAQRESEQNNSAEQQQNVAPPVKRGRLTSANTSRRSTSVAAAPQANYNPVTAQSQLGGGPNPPPSIASALYAKRYKKKIKLQEPFENFSNVGGMEKTLKELCELLLHIKCPDIYLMLGLCPPRGLLLHGPPGCGKTLLAHAIAGQMKMSLIEIPATELIAGVSGESEERIREVFEQAEAFAPCVLFIDDIDAIATDRKFAAKDMERRMVSQLISCMDNLKVNADGFSLMVIGATTRPDSLDSALRRVGRFDHEIAIGIPSRKDRKDILSLISEQVNIRKCLNLDTVAEWTPGYVGADLLALVSRAIAIAVKRECAIQMRAAKCRAERNMTTVNLEDDDDDEMSAEDSSQDKTLQSINNENNNANIIATNKTNNSNNNVLEGTPSKGHTISADQAKAAASAATPPKETVQPMEVEQQLETIDKNMSAEILPKPIVNKEPSLLELLQWLENPPEDLGLCDNLCLTLEDFQQAMKLVQPSAKREGFVTVPDVTWNDIGSLQNIREELKLAVLAPVKYPERLKRLGLSAPSGVLLCGPPGCGKTLLAKAIANEAGINFISVKGPELMSMYVGESERAVRLCFERARNSAPCVIFFDEFDSLCPKRSASVEGGSGTRIVNQLLTEMDGVQERQGVYILAATNRPDIIDPAVLRPGRLDTILYVGLPEFEDRVDILKATTKNGTCPVLHSDVDYKELAKLTEDFTGADLAGLVRQAALLALKESLNDMPMSNAISTSLDTPDDSLSVRMRHFEGALTMLRPSVTAQHRKIYENLRVKFAAPRAKSTETTKIDALKTDDIGA